MIKIVIYCLLSLSLFQTDKQIYFGGNLTYKFYFEDTNSDKVLLEVGGTSMKVGGEHHLLIKDGSSYKNEYIILKRNDENSFTLIYQGKFGFNKNILKKTTYDDKVDKIRQNIFRMVYKKFMRIENYESFLNEFNNFKSATVEYKKYFSSNKK